MYSVLSILWIVLVYNFIQTGPMNVQAALEQPRFTKGTFEVWGVQMEETIPRASAQNSQNAATR